MTPEARIGLQLAQVFGDGVVLQRHKPIPIWGTAAPGARITARLADATATTSAGGDGRWRLALDAQEAGRGQTLEVSDGEASVLVQDVAVGEVWLAGGQSNMELQLEFDQDRDTVLNGPMNPDIRFFDVPKVAFEGHEPEVGLFQFGRWLPCTPEDLRSFSAVGYYFAAQLQPILDVPVGIVGCNWGGTPACAWTPRSALETGPGSVWIEEYEKGLLADEPVIDAQHPYRPGGLFETMVERLAPFAVRGAIWYQGESDVPRADVYPAVLGSVIEAWRTVFEDPDLPFLITQLAPYGRDVYGNGDHFPDLRHQQTRIAMTVPRTWMASSSDAGEELDIHPKNKKPIGSRLALLARRHVYGEQILADAPELERASRTDEGIELAFRFGDGLRMDDRALPLQITAPDGSSITPAAVTVRGSSLLVTGAIPVGSRLAFAWQGYYDVGLTNAAGIPAVPFQVTV